MHPDDIYRAERAATIASLRYWAPTVRDCARVTDEEPGGYWRLHVAPYAPGACPFDLILLEDRFYSLMLDGRGYEDLPVDSLRLMIPLVEAIASGRVTRALSTSSRSGSLVAITDRIALAGGAIWEQSASIDGAPPREGTVDRVRRYLPYHR